MIFQSNPRKKDMLMNPGSQLRVLISECCAELLKAEFVASVTNIRMGLLSYCSKNFLSTCNNIGT